ncbi:BTB domain-containing protein [Pseudoscourfieldia marina]|uniref:BTB domain-containing protein n=2 Tax=Pycnococcus provasolii TaxID=41880 RepID=A0A7R9SYN3_9CHLO|mmetsp:Transcript_3785/g.8518  ORF Transcript_3785/g.8518 Transcript_3785/m.8518 type:complete len:349 (+) Transcript_3785:289-1335(+)
MNYMQQAASSASGSTSVYSIDSALTATQSLLNQAVRELAHIQNQQCTCRSVNNITSQSSSSISNKLSSSVSILTSWILPPALHNHIFSTSSSNSSKLGGVVLLVVITTILTLTLFAILFPKTYSSMYAALVGNGDDSETREALRNFEKYRQRKIAEQEEREASLEARAKALDAKEKELEAREARLSAEERVCRDQELRASTAVRLNVGGTRVMTSLTTLTAVPGSVLHAMFSGRHVLARDEDGAVFLDHEPDTFVAILNFLRYGKPPATPDALFDVLMDYFGLRNAAQIDEIDEEEGKEESSDDKNNNATLEEKTTTSATTMVAQPAADIDDTSSSSSSPLLNHPGTG